MSLSRIVPLIKTVYTLTGSLMGVNRQADIAVFHRLDAILDESRMRKILNYSFFTECLGVDEREVLYSFVDALQRVENRYLHPVVALRAAKLTSAMSELLQTVGSTFSSEDGGRLRFRPDPIDTTAYNREWDNLHDVVEKAWGAYRAYRAGVKDRLKV